MSNEKYALNSKLNDIQRQMVPEWDEFKPDEKLIMDDLFLKWDISITNGFKCVKENRKRIINLAFNEKKLIERGPFNFEAAREFLHKMQITLLENNQFNRATSTSDYEISVEAFKQTKLNSRLLIKCFKKLIEAFDSLDKSRQVLLAEQNENTLFDVKSYWNHINKCLICLKKAVIRCAFYIHETEYLAKSSIAVPPIYAIESDNIDNFQTPQVKIETLYQYVYLCSVNLKANISNERKEDYLANKSKRKLDSCNSLLDACKFFAGKRNRNQTYQNTRGKFFKLILNCLLHLTQICFSIRDDLIIRKLKYPQGFNLSNSVDSDVYAHFIFNECRLLTEYLKQIY